MCSFMMNVEIKIKVYKFLFVSNFANSIELRTYKLNSHIFKCTDPNTNSLTFLWKFSNSIKKEKLLFLGHRFNIILEVNFKLYIEFIVWFHF